MAKTLTYDAVELFAGAGGLAEGLRRAAPDLHAAGAVHRVTLEEVAALQTFPRGYAWSGSRSARFQAVANAVPPLLAAHVVAAVLRVDSPI